jgi:hypothetical protein
LIHSPACRLPNVIELGLSRLNDSGFTKSLYHTMPSFPLVISKIVLDEAVRDEAVRARLQPTLISRPYFNAAGAIL